MLEHFSSRGVDIAFIDVAPQANDLGEPILLIHGFASNHRVNWVEPRWVETLAGAGRRVVAFDNRGHGQSEKLYLPADYRADLMTQDAANLLAHLRIGRADVMGYSMGARLASFLALYQPSLVRALILGGMGDRLVRDAGLPEAIAEAMEAPSLDSLADPTQRMFRAFADRTKSDRAALAACVRGSRRSSDAGGSGAHRPAGAGRGRRARHRRRRSARARRHAAARGTALEIPGRDHNLTVGDRAFKAGALDFLARRE